MLTLGLTMSQCLIVDLLLRRKSTGIETKNTIKTIMRSPFNKNPKKQKENREGQGNRGKKIKVSERVGEPYCPTPLPKSKNLDHLKKAKALNKLLMIPPITKLNRDLSNPMFLLKEKQLYLSIWQMSNLR